MDPPRVWASFVPMGTFTTRGGVLWHEEAGEVLVGRVRNHYELKCWIKRVGQTHRGPGRLKHKETKLQRWNHCRNRLVRSPHLDPEGWLRWTYDTGAAIPAFSLDAKIGTETEANECSHKDASGELILDRGGLRVQGTAGYGGE